ncbi:hypothetical protein HF998_00845 [Cellulomonas hominis]|uniref:HTH cro/C1-type domain-containing protein n=1 Tax=Cellulomonas hominis TaxID=156981 RepID=A0A7W8SCF1_9CELL|nr:hypothetical protein [Cellulomonas hominis]MBB5472531.1 hypothetical protein [Cellulomonas hominis]NKY05555.1 hypothetical protein [Cellulomonas hominis]
MATSAKPIRDLDREVAFLLLAAAEKSGMNRRTMAASAEMSMNRLGKILRQEPPPASIGEFGAIAQVLGLSLGEVMREAERRIEERAAAGATVLPFGRGRSEDDEIDKLITLNPAASDPAEGYDPDAEVEAQQDQP